MRLYRLIAEFSTQTADMHIKSSVAKLVNNKCRSSRANTFDSSAGEEMVYVIGGLGQEALRKLQNFGG